MKITALETVQLPHLANILWVRLHTDEGLIGLGETFRGAPAVATYLHTEVARALVGQNPLDIDRISKLLIEPYIGFRSSGVEIRAASAIDIALWDIFGKATSQPIHQLLGGLSRERIRTYNTCAGYTYNQSGGRRAYRGKTRPKVPTKTRSPSAPRPALSPRACSPKASQR